MNIAEIWLEGRKSRNNAPYSYTQDVCVIKLNKKKFWPNFMGNVIDLGAC